MMNDVDALQDAKLDTRERLLLAGETIFASAGVAGARTRDLAAMAGVDQKLIAYHFGGKQGLYHAVLRQAAETLAADAAALAELAVTDPRAALDAAVRHLAEVAAQRRDLVLVVLRELLDGGPQELARTAEWVLPPFSGALVALDAAIEGGDARAVAPGLVAVALVALSMVCEVLPGVGAFVLPGASREQRAEAIADVLAHGLLPAPVSEEEP